MNRPWAVTITSLWMFNERKLFLLKASLKATAPSLECQVPRGLLLVRVLSASGRSGAMYSFKPFTGSQNETRG